MKRRLSKNKQTILRVLEGGNGVTVKELSCIVGSSMFSTRRTLHALMEQGLVRRTFYVLNENNRHIHSEYDATVMHKYYIV